jgi:hypothetical protein
MGFILLLVTIRTFNGDGGKSQYDKNRSAANVSNAKRCLNIKMCKMAQKCRINQSSNKDALTIKLMLKLFKIL